jgi:hypothetical protein
VIRNVVQLLVEEDGEIGLDHLAQAKVGHRLSLGRVMPPE